MMSPDDTKTPDAGSTWVDRMPASLRPYLRLMRADRPVGVWLLWLPCLWGLVIARPDGTSAASIYGYAILFGVGSFAMRSAGCIYNDIVDRELDRQVARTASRPLASGQIPLWQAWALLMVLCFLGFMVLVQLRWQAILVGLLSLGLVAAYPYMKRITWWPQAWLGLTFNWGILVGGVAISGSLSWPIVWLYLAGVFWTLGYDTIYALQDIEDDAIAGVRSSARRLGVATTTGVAAFYGVMTLFATMALLAAQATFGLVLLAAPVLSLVWQVRQLKLEDPQLALRLFKSNVWTGALMLLPLLAA